MLALEVPEEALDVSLVRRVWGRPWYCQMAMRAMNSRVLPAVIWGPLSDQASSTGRRGSSTARSRRSGGQLVEDPLGLQGLGEQDLNLGG